MVFFWPDFSEGTGKSSGNDCIVCYFLGLDVWVNKVKIVVEKQAENRPNTLIN